jgi:hypothetical protein
VVRQHRRGGGGRRRRLHHALPDDARSVRVGRHGCHPGRREWHIAESPPWWKGTTIRFGVEDGESGGAVVSFSHGGFDQDDPIIAVITPAWVRFVDNLVRVAESGVADPAVRN